MASGVIFASPPAAPARFLTACLAPRADGGGLFAALWQVCIGNGFAVVQPQPVLTALGRVLVAR